MKIPITFTVLLNVVLSFDDDTETFRKHYGLSFHANCRDYVKTFTCMSACKSIGFQVFRLDFTCKCSCHEIKTTTLLPFFKWRTNGTTRSWAKTQSPLLYHIVGTVSPPAYLDYESKNESTTIVTNGGCESRNDTGKNGGNSTDDTSKDKGKPEGEAKNETKGENEAKDKGEGKDKGKGEGKDKEKGEEKDGGKGEDKDKPGNDPAVEPEGDPKVHPENEPGGDPEHEPEPEGENK